MNKEFIPYEQALALKELGFDENCFGYFYKKELVMAVLVKNNLKMGENVTQAPLYQQAFRWFREKHKLNSYVKFDDSSQKFQFYSYNISGQYAFPFKSYEETELVCLNKLIGIVKEKK